MFKRINDESDNLYTIQEIREMYVNGDCDEFSEEIINRFYLTFDFWTIYQALKEFGSDLVNEINESIEDVLADYIFYNSSSKEFEYVEE